MSELLVTDNSTQSFQRDKDFWDKRAREYGYRASGYLTPYQRWEELLRRDTFIKKIKIEQGMKILDIGAGNGSWCRWLASKGGSVTGIDISGDMIQIAKRQSDSYIIDYRCSSIEMADFPDEYFDLIISITVLQHITDSQRLLKAISNIRRMLKPNGRFIAIEFSPVNKRENVYDADHMLYHTMGEWSDMFASCGFLVVSKTGVRFISHRVYHRLYNRAFELPIMQMSIFIDRLFQNLPVKPIQDLSDLHLFILSRDK